MFFKKTIEKLEKIRNKPVIYKEKWFNLSYSAKHYYIKSIFPKPRLCICGKKKVTDLHNISGKYSKELIDWIWLCRSCHEKFHARIYFVPKEVNTKNLNVIKDILDIK